MCLKTWTGALIVNWWRILLANRLRNVDAFLVTVCAGYRVCIAAATARRDEKDRALNSESIFENHFK
jgi:hypothetical protein